MQNTSTSVQTDPSSADPALLKEIYRFAKRRNLSAVGMTDINNFYGLIRFLLAADREGIKPIAGVVVEKEGRVLYTAFVMSRKGDRNICRLLTDSLTDSEGIFDRWARSRTAGVLVTGKAVRRRQFSAGALTTRRLSQPTLRRQPSAVSAYVLAGAAADVAFLP